MIVFLATLFGFIAGATVSDYLVNKDIRRRNLARKKDMERIREAVKNGDFSEVQVFTSEKK